MALFQASVLKSQLALLDEASVDKAYKKYQKYFWNTTIQENIKSAKEEQYQATFLNELFVQILGYTLFPNPNSNLTTEFKNEKNARKADGAILKEGLAIGVIELKGTNTKDLESIRKQAFDYKANHKECVYVITSNFEKLRFYINDATEFEEFDLFTLSRKRFDLLYLCLHIDKVLHNLPLQIKEASIAEEEEITKAFYKDYSVFKRELYRDLIKNNAKTVRAKLGASEHLDDQEDFIRLEKNVKLTLFQKSQKLIDRFLFIFFAEDRMLLTSNSTLQILNKWKDDWDFGDERPLYHLFKQYFQFLDTGRKGTEKRAEIYAYNGGLFQPDAILDALEIDNDLLYKYTNKLSNYDFESQVDVNILGHIFENSLNEIESVNAEIEGGDFDKQTSKRKKDGVFYTPKYITKYIVENTVGKLCEEKKTELGFKEADYFEVKKGTHQNTKKQLLETLDRYREWLLQLTICDPACGSGAFLNQALDFLIKEHTYIDELKTKILGGGLQFPDIENTVLENNIYGVDLNEESVEIAKLSLWLRTAQPRRKLNNLSSNIKCGNSLIDSKSVAGNKAFNWQAEFPQIFKTKDLKAYHITTAVHDSRTSDRMVKYKVRERRDLGTNPYPNVVYFTDADDLIVSQTIAGIVKEDALRLLAYNICADHIHLLLVCDIEDIPRIMQKIKAVTSKILTREHAKSITMEYTKSITMEHAPLRKSTPLRSPAPLRKPLWQQKYSAPKEITSQEQLDNTINYIQKNRSKHQLPEHSAQLKSLIDEMTMPEEEAFEDKNKSGFDVVIGNPPYGAKLPSNAKDYITKHFPAFEMNFDIYTAFIDLADRISNFSSYIGYIIPVSWQTGDKYLSTRKLITLKLKLNIGVKLPYDVFKDAYVDTGIYILTKVYDNNYNSKVFEFGAREKFDRDAIEERHLKILPSKYWMKLNSLKIVLNPFFYTLQPKLQKETTPLLEFSDSVRGILANPEDISETQILGYKKIFTGYLGRYQMTDEFSWINYGDHLREKPKDYSFFQGERIIIRRLINRQFRIMGSIVSSEFVNKKDIYNLKINDSEIMPKYILAIINSKLISFIKTKGSTSASKDDFSQLTLSDIRSIPIKRISKIEQNRFGTHTEAAIVRNQNLETILSRFKKYFSASLDLQKTSRKLQNWHELDFGDFIKELNKAIKVSNKLRAKENLDPTPTLSKKDEFEWMELFEENKKKAQELQMQIATTEREIDQMVYELYGLSEEEIAIVESS